MIDRRVARARAMDAKSAWRVSRRFSEKRMSELRLELTLGGDASPSFTSSCELGSSSSSHATWRPDRRPRTIIDDRRLWSTASSTGKPSSNTSPTSMRCSQPRRVTTYNFD